MGIRRDTDIRRRWVPFPVNPVEYTAFSEVGFEGCSPASEFRAHGDPFQFGKLRLVALEDLPIPFWRKAVDAPRPPFIRVESNN